jgi:ankyrin repeat protein
MRPIALRKILLVLLAGLAGPGCAKEDLLKHKVDVHEVFPDSRVVELAEAIADNDAKRVHLLAKSTDLRAHGDKNVTLLEWAIVNQSKRAFEALLEEGADPTLPGIDNSTAAHMAAMVNDSYYLLVLLQRGLDPNLQDQRIREPLLSASLMGGREEQFDALLAAGANPNVSDSMGDTPLHVAAQVNQYRQALVLLKSGANPLSVNAQGSTFQNYLFMGDARLLLPEARTEQSLIEDWLKEHDVPVVAHK